MERPAAGSPPERGKVPANSAYFQPAGVRLASAMADRADAG